MGLRARRAVFACAAVALILFLFAFAPPLNFSPGTIVIIEPGTSSSRAAEQLAEAEVITHPFLLRLALRATDSHTSVQAGAYRFERPQNLLTIARRLTTGDYDLPLTRITFPEGITVREIAAKVAGAFPEISETAFKELARKDEGYLFPDTYFFQLSTDAKSVRSTMRANFDAKIAPLIGDIATSGHSLADIIIMASLIEKEARTLANKKIVAGVLWNRLKLDMPLQVDAVFGYIFGRATYVPSPADLQVDSPYNTYKHRGLPPGPINNPGLESIDAALHPTKTDYLYYLTGSDNLMHYARTYAEHQANLAKYLR